MLVQTHLCFILPVLGLFQPFKGKIQESDPDCGRFIQRWLVPYLNCWDHFAAEKSVSWKSVLTLFDQFLQNHHLSELQASFAQNASLEASEEGFPRDFQENSNFDPQNPKHGSGSRSVHFYSILCLPRDQNHPN